MTAPSTDHELLVPAPPGTVWTLCTTPDGLARWFGPDGGRVHIEALELRPGGEFRGLVVGPAGAGRGRGASKPQTWPHVAEVVEVQPERRFAFDLDVPVGPGAVARARVALDLSAEGDRTRVRAEISAERADVQLRAAFGWDRALARLAAAAGPVLLSLLVLAFGVACSGETPDPVPPAVPAPPADAAPVDCAGTPPPTPRCPAESSPNCAALWDAVEAWRETCGPEEDAGPEDAVPAD